MSLETKFMFLSPVEAVVVTEDNLEEVAEWCGGRVAETESKQNPGTMEKYVWVPVPEANRISWAFPGMIVTKRLVNTLKGEIAVTFAIFRDNYYSKNYFEDPLEAIANTWERKNAKIVRPKGSPERPRRSSKKGKKRQHQKVETPAAPQQEQDMAQRPSVLSQLVKSVDEAVAIANNHIDTAIQEGRNR